jgi:DNA-binding MarR family transcriptional regulator
MKELEREEAIGAVDDLLREIFGKHLRPPNPPAGEMNITMGQMHCLGTIARLGKPTMSELAATLGLHPSTVTVLVDGLVAHGLAVRRADSGDRRIVRVAETAKGRKNHERHMATMRARVADMLAGLSDEELAKVRGSLEILRQAAQRYAESRGSQVPEPARRHGRSV